MMRQRLAALLVFAIALPADAGLTLTARSYAAGAVLGVSFLVPSASPRLGAPSLPLALAAPAAGMGLSSISLEPSPIPIPSPAPAVLALTFKEDPPAALPQLRSISDRGPPSQAGNEGLAEGRAAFDGEGTARTTPEWRRLAMSIMVAGSMNLSRTVALGRRYFAPAETTHAAIQETASRNFRRCAEFIVENAARLPLSRETAIQVNRLLTEELVPDELLGKPDFHRDSSAVFQWLESPEAARFAAADPMAMAAEVHHRFSKSDSFTDGNGRTARMMADLVLLQHGLPPAFHAGMQEYYARASHRAKAQPEVRLAYYREAVRRSQEVMERPERFSEFAPEAASRELVQSLGGDAGQEGVPVESWTKRPRKF